MALIIILIVVVCAFCLLETIGLIRAIKKARENKKEKEKEVNADDRDFDRNH